MAEGVAPCVLVVEDDQLTRTFLRHALRTTGITTAEATSGAEAIDALRGGLTPLAMLVDGLLPDMHGWDLASRVLEDPNRAPLPILFLTGALRQSIPPRAGVAALLKPIRVADLTGQLEHLRAWRDAGGSPIEERRQALAEVQSSFLVGP